MIDIDYNNLVIENNPKNCLKCIFMFTFLNTLLLLSIMLFLGFVFVEFNKNKNKIYTTIDNVNGVSKKVDNLTDNVLNIRSIISNKIIKSICSSYIGSYFGNYLCGNTTRVNNICLRECWACIN